MTASMKAFPVARGIQGMNTLAMFLNASLARGTWHFGRGTRFDQAMVNIDFDEPVPSGPAWQRYCDTWSGTGKNKGRGLAMFNSTPFQLSRIYASGWAVGREAAAVDYSEVDALAGRLNPHLPLTERERWNQGFKDAVCGVARPGNSMKFRNRLTRTGA